MDIQQTPEENLKTTIYSIYISFFNESSSDRRQVYIGQIWEKIVIWWNKFNYHKIDDANEMGKEIFYIIKRFVKDNNKPAKNKSEFFSILRESMKNAENEYFRKYEQGPIDTPREKRSKFRKIADTIRIRQNELGRKLTTNECEQIIYIFFKKQDYIDLHNAINIGSISYTSNDGNDEIDILNFAKTPADLLFDELINKINAQDVIEAVNYLLDKKQERSRDCYRALFTLHCFENIKDFEELCPVLDESIIKDCQKGKKDGKNLNQSEIYQKYHPNAQKSGAEAMASKNLSEFLIDIKTYLKEKNK